MICTIPNNYLDSNKILSTFEPRNIYECVPFVGIPAFIMNGLLPSNMGKYLIMLFTLGPLLALCAFGLGGDSLSQRLNLMMQYRKRKRKLSYQIKL